MLNQPHDHSKIMTIERHILEGQKEHPEATGELTSILYDMALAGKVISSRTTVAGLAQILGVTEDINIQGEQVMKLDNLANMIFRLNSFTGRLAAMARKRTRT
jgi:fructose-1,6-bisphosphatase I